ncbi:DNA2/NAM7 family helicase [Shewanella corallii]|uniref:DNA2/NAM7 family helicase n=1 Tax=Shewanella corallii TaxID=560080 RepID=A0ABT0N7V4_9GAMM|nr:DNA2/NAM7 family helicase [Shewanella corallii]
MQPTPINAFLGYYRDCYREDCVDLNLWNLSKLAKTDCLFIEGEDQLLTGFLPRQALAPDETELMSQRVERYQRERVLLYVSHFVVGKVEDNGERRALFSPLVYSEALLEQDSNEWFASFKEAGLSLNEPLLRMLLPEESAAELLASITAPESAATWTALLKKHSQHELEALELLSFPRLVGLEQLKRKARANTLTVLPASALVLIERPLSSRGILHELASMENAAELSNPLLCLTGRAGPQSPKVTPKSRYLPCLLSHAQQQVLEIAANQHLGLVVGPPGTGKSYTIAAVAAEHMARGKTVLVVANNEHALDVISDKLKAQFGLGDICLRAGQKAFLKQLKDYIDGLLSGMVQHEHERSATELESQLESINRTLAKDERSLLKRLGQAIRRGQRLQRLESSGPAWLKALYLALFGQSMARLQQEWQVLEEYNKKLVSKESLAAAFLQAAKSEQVQKLLDNDRSHLNTFNKAIRSRSSQRQFELFANLDYQVLQQAFPVWLVSLNTLHRVLPLQRELFDLVIFDEATQSNITSALPALFRARHALVVGDGKQLRHISFLSRAKEQELQSLHSVTPSMAGITSYRNASILDLFSDELVSQQQVAFLDEHFRSAPELIHFSNQTFYQGKLRVMQHKPCTSSGHLHLHSVGGERDAKGVNQIEVNAVISKLSELIEDCESRDVVKSIGLLSPFRAQADALNDAIGEQFSPSQQLKYQLRAATPFGFQGEERDIMLLSFGLDNSAKRAAIYLNREDVFNVAITRAREQQHLFISFDAALLPATALVRRYLDSVSDFAASHSQNELVDEFQLAVVDALRERGVETWTGYEVAGTEIDILCRQHGRYLALDLIGYPGPWEQFFELNSYSILRRAGVQVIPISYGLWRTRPQSCIDKIVSSFETRP